MQNRGLSAMLDMLAHEIEGEEEWAELALDCLSRANLHPSTMDTIEGFIAEDMTARKGPKS